MAGKTFHGTDGPSAIRVSASEGGDVVLPCSLSTNENIEKKLFDWRKDDGRTEVFMYDAGLHHNNGLSGQDEQFRGRVFHFRDELKNGVASVIIRNTTVADSGEYTCFFPLLQPPQIFHIELVVGSSPKPSVTILNATDDEMLLQCEVLGASPKPEVEWRDRAGNKLPANNSQVTERGGSYDIVLRTTVTKTDNYSCVSVQETISHQTHAEISVHISGNSSKKVMTAFYAVIALGILIAAFLICYCVLKSKDKGRPIQKLMHLMDKKCKTSCSKMCETGSKELQSHSGPESPAMEEQQPLYADAQGSQEGAPTVMTTQV
ncbi:butyrophilin subfamily 1 member A1-like [Plectropomus leopardus]|uniref:butyrophilin subfamily 1 member A1-like n=1 Tax=Plectropomus leopardus TaxID=160734 RepID=UPI001C4B1299|nr:butyrophilin subfamily 1 member A1-like [Plectropomus leopardus]